jgi:CheY-like chemotaxis protein
MVQVLIVDDDLAIREMLRIMLEYTGYSVVEAEDGDEALAILGSATEPFVVLLDHMLPTTNGLTVLRTASTEPYLAARHGYIYITASRDLVSLAQEHSIQVLGVPILGKPFEMATLLATVAAVARALQAREAVMA